MWKKWFPWRFVVRKIALAEGFVDPIGLLSKLQRFAQPSEVAAPVELLRLSTVLQARGLMNAQVIQHNLDWVWPYWVVRQFDPNESSFIPRAFSITHINLTHRNWTAIGIPDCTELPILDPRGLLTPFYDGWSLDAWVLDADGKDLIPSRLPEVSQDLRLDENLRIETISSINGSSLLSRAQVGIDDDKTPVCEFDIQAHTQKPAWLVLSLRPYNPEGVSSVDSVRNLKDCPGWEINKKHRVYFEESPDKMAFSNYRHGDVFLKVKNRNPAENSNEKDFIECDAGMATAAALFKLDGKGARKIRTKIPLNKPFHQQAAKDLRIKKSVFEGWQQSIEGSCELKIPDKKFKFLYDAAVKSMVLHSPEEDIYPGSYTYKHFWFRDAAIILHAMLCAGLFKRVEKILNSFPGRQSMNGHFCSQDGEWDSNGQALWIMRRFCDLTGTKPVEGWRRSIQKAAEWIQNKRLSSHLDELHAGLFPPGFSAEHLGPNDYYYWDDFWGVEGLRSAATMLESFDEKEKAGKYRREADEFMRDIEKSLKTVSKKLTTKVMPSSPYRRLDTAVIGSITVGYPLALWPHDDERLLESVDYLYQHHFVEGGFFHDMSHSGINPYLTLHIAQVFLRNGDVRFLELMKSIASLASSTGQWPEAVHPQTKGGCMGDGQHIWAAAEWVLMVRNCFVREEGKKLILCSGLDPAWLDKNEEISFGRTPTPFGPIRVGVKPKGKEITIHWEALWRHEEPQVEVRVPGAEPIEAKRGQTTVTLALEGKL